MLRSHCDGRLLIVPVRWRRHGKVDFGGQSLHMANSSSPNTVKEDHVVSPSDSPSDLRSLIASHTKNHKDIASERRIRLNSLYRKDAPRDHFTPTSASSKTPGASGAHSLAQRTCSMNESPVESTDSEKAVKGSDSELPDDGRVMFQGAMVKELAGHIPKNSSDELYLSGEEVRIFQCNYSLWTLKLK